MPTHDDAEPKLTREDVIKVAMLARLALSENEISSLTQELTKIVAVSYTHLTLPTILLV